MKLPEKRKRAKLIWQASQYRNTCCGIDEVFDPIRHIENELILMKPDFSYGYEKKVWANGVLVEAKVQFRDGMHMEISETAVVEAKRGLGRARFTLCHEIGHVNLHQKKMNGRIDGASRPRAMPPEVERRAWRARGVPDDHQAFQIHSEDAAMEREADLYSGCLLIPIERINVNSDFNVLAKKYQTSPAAAYETRLNVLEVWSAIHEIRKRKGL